MKYAQGDIIAIELVTDRIVIGTINKTYSDMSVEMRFPISLDYDGEKIIMMPYSPVSKQEVLIFSPAAIITSYYVDEEVQEAYLTIEKQKGTKPENLN